MATNDLIDIVINDDNATITIAAERGAPGIGALSGGTADQYIKKIDNVDFSAEWTDFPDVLTKNGIESGTNKTFTAASNNIHATATHLKVRNVSGGTLIIGQPVKLVGYNVGLSAIEVTLADQSIDIAFGIVEETFINASNGLIVMTGVMEDLDTSLFVEGDILYVNGVGLLTNIRPTTGFMQAIALCLRSNAINGVIQVLATYPLQDAADVRYTGTLTSINVQAALDELEAKVGGELNELTDVEIVTVQNGDILSYNSTSSKWENIVLAGGGDMIKTIYDPLLVLGDAFAMDNMAEGTTNKILSISERTLIASALQSETNDLTSAVTWANIPDLNITQTSVTQHEGALSITESQIFDFGTYQPLDTDLTNIAALTASSGFLKTDGATIWTVDTNSYSLTSHNHTGVYEPADATILKDSDIGVNIQAYNVNTALTTDITYETLNTNGDVGTTTGTLAIGDHDHDADYATKNVNINTQTGTTYTLVLTDAGTKLVEMNNAAANTLTVPPNSSVAFPIGTKIDVVQYGAGATTVTQGAGVTIRTAETLVLDGIYSGATLYKRATDEWVLIGRLVAA